MAENNVKSNSSSQNKASLNIIYEGWNENIAKSVDKNKKIENIKNKILGTIDTNIEYYKTKGKNLSPTVRILKDVEDYTTIILRCGTFPIWKNTVKKGMYSEIDILEDLYNKVSSNYFEKEIEGYLNKGTKKSSKKIFCICNFKEKIKSSRIIL